MDKIKVMGVNFDNLSLDEAVNLATSYIERNQKISVVTPNSEILYECRKNPSLRELINSADLILPDGVGVLYAAKIFGSSFKQRVAGIDFAMRLMSEFAKKNIKLFLLGAKPGVAELAASNLSAQFPGLCICGLCDGYFSSEDDVVSLINRSGAQALFACLGFPKQENFILSNRERLCSSLSIGLGGCLDIFSGNSRRAPDFFIRFGLEWLYRLIRQPSRIIRMLRLPLFMFCSLKDRLFHSEL